MGFSQALDGMEAVDQLIVSALCLERQAVQELQKGLQLSIG